MSDDAPNPYLGGGLLALATVGFGLGFLYLAREAEASGPVGVAPTLGAGAVPTVLDEPAAIDNAQGVLLDAATALRQARGSHRMTDDPEIDAAELAFQRLSHLVREGEVSPRGAPTRNPRDPVRTASAWVESLRKQGRMPKDLDAELTRMISQRVIAKSRKLEETVR